MVFSDALCGAIIAETITTALVLCVFGASSSLRNWYRRLGLSAIVLDIASLALGAFIGLRNHDALAAQVGIAVLVCVLHDVAFGALIQTLPRGRNLVIDLFKDYAAQKRGRILVDDAMMIAGAVVAARTVSTFRDDAFAIAALFGYANLILVHSF